MTTNMDNIRDFEAFMSEIQERIMRRFLSETSVDFDATQLGLIKNVVAEIHQFITVTTKRTDLHSNGMLVYLLQLVVDFVQVLDQSGLTVADKNLERAMSALEKRAISSICNLI